MFYSKFVSIGFLLLIFVCTADCSNKYSKEANIKKKTGDVDFRTLEKPFRMHKLNLVWIKAQQRLTEPKLKSLYSDLMIHDKEELILKRVKSEGGDKDGLREADLRRKLTNIMGSYGLRQHFEDHTPDKTDEHSAFNSVVDDHINRSLFKDKKLNILWSKAENSGFTSEELSALKEEFQHHQDKIDQYYDLLNEVDAGKTDQFKNAVNEEELDQFNEIPSKHEEPSKDYLHQANLVRDQHRVLRDGYDRLQRIAAKGPNSSEFVEPKVQGLWRMAAAASFTVDELASIKVELQHYESRLLKLRRLHADQALLAEKTSKTASAGDKAGALGEQEHVIKKHARKVEKMHQDLETRILAKHNEL